MDKKRIIHYFALVHFLTTGAISIWSYSTNYFREVGFDAQQIGAMNAAGTFLSMLALPVAGVISDRLRSPRKVYIAMVLAAIPLYLLFPVVGQTLGKVFWVFLLLVALTTVTRQVTNSCMDSWAGAEMDRLEVSFGSIRRFGSFGYVIVSLVCSLIIGPVLPYWTFALWQPLLSLPLLYVIGGSRGRRYTFADPKERPVGTLSLMKFVFKNYYFLCYLLLVVAFDAFLGIVNLDMSYLMDHVGANRSDMGFVGGVRAATEIVMMIWLGRQKKLPPLWILLGLSGLFLAAEHLLYPCVSGLYGMMAVTLLSGIAGGFYYCFGANYVFKIVDHRAASTAMAVLGVVKSLIAVIGSGFGGTVIETWGVITLTTAVGILILVLTGLFLLSCLLGRYVLKKPYVSELPSESASHT